MPDSFRNFQICALAALLIGGVALIGYGVSNVPSDEGLRTNLAAQRPDKADRRRAPRKSVASKGNIESERAARAKRQAETLSRKEQVKQDRQRQIAEKRRSEVLERARKHQAKKAAAKRLAAAQEKEQQRQKQIAEIASREQAIRLSLLRQAKSMALSSDQPWKELLAVAFLERQNQDRAGMLDSFERAEKLAQFPGDTRATGNAMLTILRAMLRAKEFDLALELASRFTDPNFNDRAYFEVAASSARSGRIVYAKTLAEGIENLQFRERALSQISQAQLRQNDAASAQQTIGLISDLNLRDDALLRVAGHQAALGDFVAAGSTLYLVQAKSHRDRGLSSLALEHLKRREIDEVSDILPQIESASIRGKVRLAVAKRQADLGDITRARQTGALLVDSRMREDLSRYLAVASARKGSFSLAVNELEKIETTRIKAAGLKDVSLIHSRVAGSSAAGYLVNRMSDSAVRDTAYAALALSEFRKNGAFAASRIVKNIQQKLIRQNTTLKIAEFAIQEGQFTTGVQLLKKVESEFLLEPDDVSPALRSKVIELYGGTGLKSEAMGRINFLPTTRDKDSVLSKLAKNRAGKADIRGAQAYAEQIQNDKKRDQSFVAIAAHYGRQVELKDAERAMHGLNTPEEKLKFIVEFFRS